MVLIRRLLADRTESGDCETALDHDVIRAGNLEAGAVARVLALVALTVRLARLATVDEHAALGLHHRGQPHPVELVLDPTEIARRPKSLSEQEGLPDQVFG